jgi:hypothetical protein
MRSREERQQDREERRDRVDRRRDERRAKLKDFFNDVGELITGSWDAILNIKEFGLDIVGTLYEIAKDPTNAGDILKENKEELMAGLVNFLGVANDVLGAITGEDIAADLAFLGDLLGLSETEVGLFLQDVSDSGLPFDTTLLNLAGALKSGAKKVVKNELEDNLDKINLDRSLPINIPDTDVPIDPPNPNPDLNLNRNLEIDTPNPDNPTNNNNDFSVSDRNIDFGTTEDIVDIQDIMMRNRNTDINTEDVNRRRPNPSNDDPFDDINNNRPNRRQRLDDQINNNNNNNNNRNDRNDQNDRNDRNDTNNRNNRNDTNNRRNRRNNDRDLSILFNLFQQVDQETYNNNNNTNNTSIQNKNISKTPGYNICNTACQKKVQIFKDMMKQKGCNVQVKLTNR